VTDKVIDRRKNNQVPERIIEETERATEVTDKVIGPTEEQPSAGKTCQSDGKSPRNDG